MPQESAAADDFADDADSLEWQQRFEAKQRKIRSAPNVQNELNRLAKDGADAAKVLWLVALLVPDDDRSRIEFLKSRQQRLTALANKFERISEEVAAAFSNPLNSSAFVAFGHFREIVEDFPREADLKTISTAARKRTMPLLKGLRAEARAFGRMAGIYSRFKRDEVLGILLRYVKESTGQFHDETLASLLQTAHDELGVEATFGAEQLRILRRRNFPELTRKRKKDSLLDNPLWKMLVISPLELDKTESKN